MLYAITFYLVRGADDDKIRKEVEKKNLRKREKEKRLLSSGPKQSPPCVESV